MIAYREIDETYFEKYDSIPMLVHVNTILKPEKLENGLGGILLKETPVDAYVKDLGIYEEATKYSQQFDIANWAFFMAFDGEHPVGAMTLVSRTQGVNMLDGRDDLSVLWDIRVADSHKQQGIGSTLFHMAVDWSTEKGFKQMKIECQNNNVPACKFYRKHGAVLGRIDEYAYYGDDEDACNEIQLIWYLDL